MMRLSDAGAPAAIARLLAAELTEAPFRVPDDGDNADAGEGSPVYELRLRSREHEGEILLLIWPSLERADVRLGKSTWTLKAIDAVEMYPGVEVLFRREEPAAILFVSVDTLIMRFTDVMLCFPTFFLILTVVALLPPSIFNIMAVIGM